MFGAAIFTRCLNRIGTRRRCGRYLTDFLFFLPMSHKGEEWQGLSAILFGWGGGRLVKQQITLLPFSLRNNTHHEEIDFIAGLARSRTGSINGVCVEPLYGTLLVVVHLLHISRESWWTALRLLLSFLRCDISVHRLHRRPHARNRRMGCSAANAICWLLLSSTIWDSVLQLPVVQTIFLNLQMGTIAVRYIYA